MEQVRCTNCGSAAVIPESGEFCKCESCGSTFCVSRAIEFSKVTLDHTQDIRAWREYLAKQIKLQQDSVKARNYGGVKLFAQKILSVLPDDFCARYYVALAERYDGNDTAYLDFLNNAAFLRVTPEEKREVVDSLITTVEPKYIDAVKSFISRAYPDSPGNFDAALDRSVKLYIQKLRYAKAADRDVFICHRTDRPDQDIADAICTRLEERGLRCWIAPRNILAGSQNYERDILKGVENSRVFLLVSSFKSIYSQDCEMELKAAVLDDKALYSYKIDDTPYDGVFEKALDKVQWLDASDDPYAHLEQLVIDIKGILAEDEREKAMLEEKRLAARERERQLAEERRASEQERIDRLEKIVSRGTITSAPANKLRSRLKRAEIELQSENFDAAEELLDAILDDDPENAEAWWLMLLSDCRVTADEQLLELNDDFTANRYFKAAKRLAVGGLASRIDKLTVKYKNRAVREMCEILDRAEQLLHSEDFDALKAIVKNCAPRFAAEDSLIFKKFPDIASRYFWLKLWAKYGQTHLVCVEDITRESEYQTAMKYASPAQAQEYIKERDVVSKNAELFLRERAKNRDNDGKLFDYLADNKNILPVDVYNYYSSLLYYRKMLDQLGMTGAQLRASTADITTNEYFMLAQSLATDEQRIDYDALVNDIERNRRNKRESDIDAKNQKLERQKRMESKKRTSNSMRTAMSTVTSVFAYMLFISACISFIDKGIVTASLTAAAVFRLANDIINLKPYNGGARALVRINFVMSVLSLIATVFAIGAYRYVNLNAPFLCMLSIACIVLEIIAMKRHSNYKGDGT